MRTISFFLSFFFAHSKCEGNSLSIHSKRTSKSLAFHSLTSVSGKCTFCPHVRQTVELKEKKAFIRYFTASFVASHWILASRTSISQAFLIRLEAQLFAWQTQKTFKKKQTWNMNWQKSIIVNDLFYVYLFFYWFPRKHKVLCIQSRNIYIYFFFDYFEQADGLASHNADLLRVDIGHVPV